MDRVASPGHNYRNIVATNSNVQNGDYYAPGSITIVDTTGTVANILDRLTNSLEKIRESSADDSGIVDMAMLHFETSIGTWKAALKTVQEWLELDLDHEHHLLRMDLDRILTFSRLLITTIDGLFANSTSKSDRLQGVDSLQKMIDGQIGGLNMLLTKQSILVSKQSRKLMSRLEKDTASLIVHRDDRSSTRSLLTDTCSKASIVFAFDKELWVTDVYERFFRSLTKKNLREQQANIAQPAHVEQSASLTQPSTSQTSPVRLSSPPSQSNKDSEKRSLVIDRTLETDSKRLRRECKVLMLGTFDHDMDVFSEGMLLEHGIPYTTEELVAHRQTIYRTCVHFAKVLARRAVELELQIDEDDIERILEYTVDTGAQSLDDEFVLVVTKLWTEARDHQHPHILPRYAVYLLDEVPRISMPTYAPSGADVLRARLSMYSIHETNLRMGALTIRISLVPQRQQESKKYLHMFEHATSIIFTVDLCAYDMASTTVSDCNSLGEPLLLFNSIVNSQWFTRTSVILLLCNADSFKSKLAHAPLERWFPDYRGGNDMNRAAKYILWRFNLLNRRQLNLYPHLLREFQDPNTLRLIFAAVKETILGNALHDSDFLRPSSKDKRKRKEEKEKKQKRKTDADVVALAQPTLPNATRPSNRARPSEAASASRPLRGRMEPIMEDPNTGS